MMMLRLSSFGFGILGGLTAYGVTWKWFPPAVTHIITKEIYFPPPPEILPSVVPPPEESIQTTFFTVKLMGIIIAVHFVCYGSMKFIKFLYYIYRKKKPIIDDDYIPVPPTEKKRFISVMMKTQK